MRPFSSALSLVGIFLLFGGTSAMCAAKFEPQTFQSPDGAIVLNPGGDYVEPYFATKALIVAQDGGLDVRDSATAWIQWALPRQRQNGLFRRFCRKNGEWKDCAAADADDSMLALWMELLYRMAPAGGMPSDWQRSTELAWRQLEKLRNGRLGVYHISRRNHVALFMDNVEVYAALKDIAQVQAQWHDPEAATTEARAQELGHAIDRIFWDHRAHRFRPSMQKTVPAFYPDVVAQVYPWLADISPPGEDSHEAWVRWRGAYATAWIDRRYDSHPWGLVALAAEKLGDNDSAECWESKSNPLRGGSSWNVLEEAVWQSLRAHYSQSELLDPNACEAVLAQR